MQRVLIVDDEESIAWGLAQAVKAAGCQPSVAASAEDALELLADGPVDMVFLDVRLPGMSGLDAMRLIARRSPGAPIVVITAFGDLETAVTAYQQRAFDYLLKPFTLAQVDSVVQRALAAASQPKRPAPRPNVEPIGASRAMQEVFKRVAMVASSDASVFLAGESGVGKEVIARAIHNHSPRGKGPFVALRLAAYSPLLFESELFGHERPSDGRTGVFEEAQGGTLFLADVDEAPWDIQTRMLRLLEQQEFAPVGSQRTVARDFRVLASSAKDLRQAARDGTFREDLFFRLAEFEICVPPLRDRLEDLEALAQAFLDELDAPGPLALSAAALANLKRRRWTGNVRQLRAVVQAGALAARQGQVGVEHLPSEEDRPRETTGLPDVATAVRDWALRRLADSQQPFSLYEEFLEATEPSLFETVLARTNQNRAAAAEVLGIHRATLRKKLSQQG